MYVDAESEPYGISVRLKGSVTPNETTGQVTASFTENPEQPFSNLVIHLKGGALAPIANPLSCGTATTQTSFVPFSGTATQSPTSAFTVDSNNAGGACASPVPFALTQTTENQSAKGGGHTNFTFNLGRGDGQQYLSQVKTVLPPGLVGAIPAVTQCGEPQASQGTCPESSRIGTARVTAGAGATPYTFSGPAYLTGPYKGAPFGLSIAVPAVAGPFNLGTVVTRATINVEPMHRPCSGHEPAADDRQGRSTAPEDDQRGGQQAGLPVQPDQLRAVRHGIDADLHVRRDAIACRPRSRSTTATRSGSSRRSSSASTGKTSKANGASLETTINQAAGQANIKSVVVQLPKQLPSRLTTLQKACVAATFEANPYRCPAGSYVGGARANSPTLPGKLTGPAVLVSHGGAAFPDLDLVMEADGVRVIVVGNTNIKNGITTTSFKTTPDVPVTSVTVNLPTGPHSALAANGNLCASSLVMPTTITGQNGKVVKQNTKIRVTNCGVRIVGQKTAALAAYLTVQTYSAGRISGSGSSLATVYRYLGGAVKSASLKVPLTRGALFRGRPFSVKRARGLRSQEAGADRRRSRLPP